MDSPGASANRARAGKLVAVPITDASALFSGRFACTMRCTSSPMSPGAHAGRPRVKGERYPLTLSGVKTAWRRLRASVQGSWFRFHDFRHDLGSKLLRETGNLKLVQRALNHTDLKTTTRYAHVLDDEVADALERVSTVPK